MRPSEIVMTLCAIDEQERVKPLSSGQKAYKTRLENKLKMHLRVWARQDYNKAMGDFWAGFNLRANGRHVSNVKYRRQIIEEVKKCRLKLEKARKR